MVAVCTICVLMLLSCLPGTVFYKIIKKMQDTCIKIIKIRHFTVGTPQLLFFFFFFNNQTTSSKSDLKNFTLYGCTPYSAIYEIIFMSISKHKRGFSKTGTITTTNRRSLHITTVASLLFYKCRWTTDKPFRSY